MLLDTAKICSLRYGGVVREVEELIRGAGITDYLEKQEEEGGPSWIAEGTGGKFHG